ncbi:virion core protein [Cetacean poxvirus 1]|nr:virion core protein [Cetacean poxvirus 1]
MELINVFLDTDTGRVKIDIVDKKTISIKDAINNIVTLLNNYIVISHSVFYLAIKDKDIFVFKCYNGTVTLVQNDFFVFDDNLIFSNNYDVVKGIEFIITESMPIHIKAKNKCSIKVSASNNRYYQGLH